MRCIIKKCDILKDWYLIVRQEHENKEWYIESERGTIYCNSERLEPESCVEGSRAEMLVIANIILKNKSHTAFRRIAAQKVKGGYLLYSPKNTAKCKRALVTMEEAKDLAAQIINHFKGHGKIRTQVSETN